MSQDKIKVMVVDDESIFREYMLNNIDWESIGMEICCEAKNGIEAFELAIINRPNIALLDINMPYLNGLDLLKKMKEELPQIAVIFITGYGEFEYARVAIKHGAADYILKPFEDEELISALIKTKSLILKEREKVSMIQSNIVFAREQLLNMLITNDCNIDEEVTIKRLNSIGIYLKTQNFRVATVEIDNLYQKWNDLNEIELWQYAVTNILNEVVNKHENHIFFNGPEGRIISIVEMKENMNISPKEIGYEQLCRLIKKYLGFTVTIGVGSVYYGLCGIRSSYLEAVAAVKSKFIQENDKVIEYAKLNNEGINIGFYPNEVNEDIINSLRMNNWGKIHMQLDEVFRYIKSEKLPIDYIYMICSGLISLCLSYLTEINCKISSLFGEKFLPFSEIRKKESIEVLQKWVGAIYDTAISYIDGMSNSRSKKIAGSVIDYISNNYSDSEMSLKDIADSLFLNPDYLRATFKKETALTISQYITNFRMKKAKELLNCQNIKLSGIAELVGYSDESYFSKCFKKYFGMTPSEYINVK